MLLYFVCIKGSAQYSQSHCPVLLRFYLYYKLFIIGPTNKDGWMDGLKPYITC